MRLQRLVNTPTNWKRESEMIKSIALALLLSAPVYADKEPEWMGFSEDQCLRLSGFNDSWNETDYAHSNNHNHGDLCNRWSHGTSAEFWYWLTDSHIFPVFALYWWETTNRKITLSDINTAPINLTKDGKWRMVLSAEGGVIFNYRTEY